MNRRLFAQLCALGAGSLSAWSASRAQAAGEEEVAGEPNDQPPGAAAAQVSKPLAVNVADFQALARAALPKATYDYITTGSADGLTLDENVAAFQRLQVLPPLLTGVAAADLRTRVLGEEISLPVMLAPVAAQSMFHREGALAAARAAASAGTLFGVSSSAGHSVEEIAAAAKGPMWLQLYVPKDRDVARKLIGRVERAGYRALVVTVDLGEWKDADRRNGFALSKPMLVKRLRDIGYEQVTDRWSYDRLVEFNATAFELSLSWDFFGWLRSITRLPLLIKGVLRQDDARRAVELGLDGIIVSNHGGRRLDGMPSSIEMLPEVVKAADGRAEVYLDSGVRRGTDVLKALALGARAVLIGRPYAWALAAGGEAGVRNCIELLRDELANAMVATGCAKVADIQASLIKSNRG